MRVKSLSTLTVSENRAKYSKRHRDFSRKPNEIHTMRMFIIRKSTGKCIGVQNSPIYRIFKK